MDTLLQGYRRFREGGWPDRRKVYEGLAERGQKPSTLVIGCVDSRVDPAVIFDAAPGQILSIRNVANLVPPYEPDSNYHGTSAALEFGVCVLEIPHLVVLGHGQCGGVNALLNGAPIMQGDFFGHWMSLAQPARDRTLRCDPADPQTTCEEEVIRVSLDNLMTFPWIAERVRSGRLRLHGAWFAIRTGELRVLGADGAFAAA